MTTPKTPKTLWEKWRQATTSPTSKKPLRAGRDFARNLAPLFTDLLNALDQDLVVYSNRTYLPEAEAQRIIIARLQALKKIRNLTDILTVQTALDADNLNISRRVVGTELGIAPSAIARWTDPISTLLLKEEISPENTYGRYFAHPSD